MNKVLKALLSLDAAFILASGMLGPIYAIFVEQIGGDILDASGAMAGFSFSFAIIVFLISRWEDRVKHKKTLIFAGYTVTAVAFLGYYLIENPFDLLVVQMLLGVGGAITTPAYDGVYSRFLDKGKFISEWGVWETMNSAVLGIAALAGGFIAFEFGFRSLFIVMFVIAVLGMIASGAMLKKTSF